MYLRSILTTLLLLLTACGNIPHDTPEARQHIKEDLKLSEITDTSVTSFCWLRIGGPAMCRATAGISVLTPDSLLLVDYEGGKYVQKDVIKTDYVKCIHGADEKMFYIFTDQIAVMVIPYIHVPHDPPTDNPRYRAKAIKMLLSEGQRYITADMAPMKVTAGQKDYQVVNTYSPGGSFSTVVATDAYYVVSPCSASN